MHHPFPTLSRRVLVMAAAAAALAGCATPPALDAASVLARAEAAMGGSQLKSLRIAGKGTGATFGQAYEPGLPWPRLNVSQFVRVMDYEAGAMRQETAVSRSEPNGGGAVPLMGMGEQRAVGVVQGDFAWNMVGPAQVAAPVAHSGRMHDLWTSPHGVLKAAARSKAVAGTRNVEGKTYTTLSFRQPGAFEATAFLNAEGLVERVESRQPHAVMGDTESVISYTGYKSHGGVQFPSRITQRMGGSEIWSIEVTEVQPGVASGIAATDAVKQFKETVASQKVTDGVWFLAGGSHNSVLIEMKDYLMLVEAPLYDGRSAAVIAEARKLVPGKPIRFAVNSHHHFDHAGGLRTAAAEGIALVTSAAAKPWFEKTLANPNSIVPDALARSGRQAMVESVNGSRTFSDGARTVNVLDIGGSVHARGFLMVHLPAEKLLIEADAYTPGAPGTPPSNPPNANNVNLLENIERQKLAVERILPLHGRVVPLAELAMAAGRR